MRTPAKSPGRRARISLAAIAVAGLALAGCTSTASPKPAPSKSLTLTVGALLPQTGSFAALAPAETAGVQLAVDDINQANLGVRVKLIEADSGDATTGAAKTAVKSLLSKHVTAIVGPTSNDVTALVIGQITGAGIVMVSPQNSAAAFTDDKDHGLYFRTSPSDTAEGAAIGRLAAKDGASTLGVIALKDAYGTAVQHGVTASFEKAGGEVVTQQTFAATDTDFGQQVAAVAKAKPDAVVLASEGHATALVPALIAAGIPANHLYFSDSDLSSYGASMPVPLTGAQGVAAGAVLDSFFQKKLLTVNPTLTAYAYAPESYDAVVVLALAALAAHSTDGAKLAARLPAVTGGTGHGEKATDFASAAQIILAGDPVDYDGYSGGIAFDRQGDPTQAVFGTFRYSADNTFSRLG